MLVSACGKTSDGEPVADDVESVAESTPSTTVTSTPDNEGHPDPGGRPHRTRRPAHHAHAVAPGTVTCAVTDPPPDGVTAATLRIPAAPKITVALPAGWSTTQGDGDVGAKLTGPEGIWATVTIAKTTLDPAAAFKQYADDAMAASAVSSVSVLPADLCGYSGQKLLGSWSDTP